MSENDSDLRIEFQKLRGEFIKTSGAMAVQKVELEKYSDANAIRARNQAIGVLGFVALLGGLGIFASIWPIVTGAAAGIAASKAESELKKVETAAKSAEEIVAQLPNLPSEVSSLNSALTAVIVGADEQCPESFPNASRIGLLIYKEHRDGNFDGGISKHNQEWNWSHPWLCRK